MKLDSNEISFTLYRSNGQRDRIKGLNLANAFERTADDTPHDASLKARIVLIDRGEVMNFWWSVERKKWEKRFRAFVTNDREELSREFLSTHLDRYQYIAFELPSKDQVIIEKKSQQFDSGVADFISVSVAHYSRTEDGYQLLEGARHFFSIEYPELAFAHFERIANAVKQRQSDRFGDKMGADEYLNHFINVPGERTVRWLVQNH